MNHRRLLAAACLAALLPLGACGTTGATNLDAFITTMSKTNCAVHGTVNAQVGAMNPGSGVNLQATIDCPNGQAAAAAALTPAPAAH